MPAPLDNPIRITAVLGSMRQDSFTAKVLELIADQLHACDGVLLDTIDPAELALAFPGQRESEALEARLFARVLKADGLVFTTPEYHGSYSSVLKVLIDNMGYPSALEGKPIALAGIAAGRIGAVKALEHLRGVCAHVGAMPLPYPVSIAEVQSKFNAQGHCTDPELIDQLHALADRLVDYIRHRRAGGISQTAD